VRDGGRDAHDHHAEDSQAAPKRQVRGGEKHVQRDREAVPESPPITRDDAEERDVRQEECQAVGPYCAIKHSV
jgi:hypothetical protein